MVCHRAQDLDTGLPRKHFEEGSSAIGRPGVVGKLESDLVEQGLSLLCDRAGKNVALTISSRRTRSSAAGSDGSASRSWSVKWLCGQTLVSPPGPRMEKFPQNRISRPDRSHAASSAGV